MYVLYTCRNDTNSSNTKSHMPALLSRRGWHSRLSNTTVFIISLVAGYISSQISIKSIIAKNYEASYIDETGPGQYHPLQTRKVKKIISVMLPC